MKKVAIGLSFSINAIVLLVLIWAASGGFFSMARNFFILPGHQRWVTQFEVLGIQPGDTVFLGDSITEGGKWHELFPGSNAKNRGIGGDVTPGVLDRLDPITAGRPGKIFLLIGTNDLSFGTSQEEIISNISEIIDNIRSASPQTEVFVQSILPRGANYATRIESLNAALETAIADSATWINLYPLFLDDAGVSIDDSLSNDELHLLGEGYNVWRDAIGHLVD